MLKKIRFPFLLCFFLLAAWPASSQQQLVFVDAAQLKVVPLQIAPPAFNHLPNKMAYITTVTSVQSSAAHVLSSDANPAGAPVLNKDLAIKSVATGAGILGLIAGGRLSNKWALTPKLGIYGGVGWGDKVCNVGIIF